MWGHVEMKNKQNITLYLDREVIEKARELGLNISKVCENALIQAVKALEDIFTEKGGNLGTVGSWWCSGGDLNPRLRLERPPYLTGLYYRSLQTSKSSSCSLSY